VLTDAGLRVLERRYRCRVGEIDIVAEQGELLVFVEVKARGGVGYGVPAAAVNSRKRRRLARVALDYMTRHDADRRPSRFDVVEVLVSGGRVTSVRHIEDAFRLWPTG
jgi:putative endonuclease